MRGICSKGYGSDLVFFVFLVISTLKFQYGIFAGNMIDKQILCVESTQILNNARAE